MTGKRRFIFMRKTHILNGLTAALALVAGTVLADQTNRINLTNQPPAQLNSQQLRDELSKMTPEQRRARLQELRKQHGTFDASTITNQNGAAFQFSPDQRRAKIKEKIAELQAKKTNGTISETEDKQLERLKLMEQRLDQPGKPNTPAPAVPQTAPPPPKTSGSQQ